MNQKKKKKNQNFSAVANKIFTEAPFVSRNKKFREGVFSIKAELSMWEAHCLHY